jgi:beta-glucosidase
MNRLKKSPLFVLLLAMGISACNNNNNNNTTSNNSDDAASAGDKARELVAKMTLEQKIAQLHGAAPAMEMTDEAVAKLFEDAKKDPSLLLMPRRVDSLDSLDIPAMRFVNGPSGVGTGDNHPQDAATALPSPIALAATWDVAAAKEFGKVQGSETILLNYMVMQAPSMNIARVPQGGRVFEAFGEDPFLTSKIAVNNILGIQGEGAMAVAKHYAANNQETNRLSVNEIIDDRTLREIYLPAFEASVKQGKVASIMSAYNKVNGVYCSENNYLLNDILKDEWGFNGFVYSDFGATRSTVPSALNGLDLEMPNGIFYGDSLLTAVKSGKVKEADIDEKLIRRFAKMYEYGFFDQKNKSAGKIPAKENGAISRRIAERSVVLLKNENSLLPLRKENLKSVALIGAEIEIALAGGGGSSHVVPLYTVTPLQGLKNKLGNNVAISTSKGNNTAETANIAKKADVAIVILSLKTTEGMDNEIVFSKAQNDLVEKVAAANPKTIVVIKTGSSIILPWINKVPALVEAWYPGEEDGNVVASVLLGEVNPSGKLPLSFPKQLSDLPANTKEQFPGVKNVARYSEGIFVGYRHFDKNKIEPLFPFGYGLSYTTFKYKNPKVTKKGSANSTAYEEAFTVELDVTNTGKVAGAEVAQLYLGLPSTRELPQAPGKLAGFTRVELKPGETKRVSIPVEARSLSYWDVKTKSWKRVGGEAKIMIGSSSRNIHANLKFT